MIPQEHRDLVEQVLAEHDVPPLPDDVRARSRDAARLGATTKRAPRRSRSRSSTHQLLANALGPPPKDVVDPRTSTA